MSDSNLVLMSQQSSARTTCLITASVSTISCSGASDSDVAARPGAPAEVFPPRGPSHEHQLAQQCPGIDKDRRKGKGRRFCLGGRINSIACRASCFALDDLKNRMNCTFERKGGIHPLLQNPPRQNSQRVKELYKFFPPKTAAKTFTFTFILLLWPYRSLTEGPCKEIIPYVCNYVQRANYKMSQICVLAFRSAWTPHPWSLSGQQREKPAISPYTSR